MSDCVLLNLTLEWPVLSLAMKHLPFLLTEKIVLINKSIHQKPFLWFSFISPAALYVLSNEKSVNTSFTSFDGCFRRWATPAFMRLSWWSNSRCGAFLTEEQSRQVDMTEAWLSSHSCRRDTCFGLNYTSWQMFYSFFFSSFVFKTILFLFLMTYVVPELGI